jgi:Fanconi anemia group M protein
MLVPFVPKIIVDLRESHYVLQALQELKVDVVEKTISPGDYVVGEGFAVERKTFRDFVSSIFKKRLFEQLQRLREAYERSCLIIEGDIGYGLADLTNPLVFWGALAHITAEWNIPVVFTTNEEQTAQFLFSLAKRLQEEKEAAVEAIHKPKRFSLADRQKFAVQGLPTVGPKSADKLLKRFGSVRRVFTAREHELRRIDGFGDKRTREISQFLDMQYIVEGMSR